MKTISVNLYSFDELSDKAKQYAIDKFISDHEFFWSDAYIDTIKEGIDIFDFELYNWRIDFFSGHYDCSLRSGKSELSGLRLRTYLLNNYYSVFYRRKEYGKRKSKITYEKYEHHITGYCADQTFLQPIIDFINKPDAYKTFGELMDDCIYAVVMDGRNDYEYQCTEEYISDHCEANEYMFYENGEMH